MKQVSKEEMIKALDDAFPNGSNIMGGAFFGSGASNNTITFNGVKFETRTVSGEKQYFVER